MPSTSRGHRSPDVDAYLARLEMGPRLVAHRLRELVHAASPAFEETIAYGVPFFRLDGTRVCYVSGARAHVTFGFLEGVMLDDPDGLLTGTGRSPIRKATLKPDAPWSEAALRRLLAQAVRLAVGRALKAE